MEKLKPCPFCGNTEPRLISNGIGDLYVICRTEDQPEEDRGCGARSSDYRCEHENLAAERWNRRAAE